MPSLPIIFDGGRMLAGARLIPEARSFKMSSKVPKGRSPGVLRRAIPAGANRGRFIWLGLQEITVGSSTGEVSDGGLVGSTSGSVPLSGPGINTPRHRDWFWGWRIFSRHGFEKPVAASRWAQYKRVFRAF